MGVVGVWVIYGSLNKVLVRFTGKINNFSDIKTHGQKTHGAYANLDAT
jgi:Zn-finger nucleic acid-binding protein